MLNQKNQYPKVLIIGHHMDLRSGGGITIHNLFKGWPLDRIFFASNLIRQDGARFCRTFYSIGFDENKMPWPLSVRQKRYFSGEVILENKTEKEGSDVPSDTIEKDMGRKEKVVRMLHFFGIYYLIYRFYVSKKFLQWIEKENPDIIYAQPNERLLKFLLQTKRKTKLPLVLHFMDDWPNIMNQPGLSKLFWNGKKQRELKSLLKNSQGLMSISQSMSDEYKNRYGFDFTPFHNCIEAENWIKFQKKNCEAKGTFTILYAGRIGIGTSNSILKIAHVVENLNKQGTEIKFEIQGLGIPYEIAREIEQLKHVRINKYIEYSELPKKFSEADLLVLPMDFDKENFDFIHLSMPTKVPEYMACGTPIFVFAPEKTALSRYATKSKWAFVENKNTEEAILNKLKRIVENQDEREKISQTAKRMAVEVHESEIVRKKFREYLVERI